MRAALLVAAGLLIAGCEGLIVRPPLGIDSDGGPPDAGLLLPDGGPAAGDVFARLSPTCVACHGFGSNRPYFVSQVAFQTLLVADRKWIIPGKPDQSPLLALLDGKGSGAFVQMPVGKDSFAVKATRGETLITLPELAAWIAAMDPDPMMLTPTADPGAPLIQRKSARQLGETMLSQLGLTAAELKAAGYLATSPDDVLNNADTSNETFIRFQQLGGAHWLGGKRANKAPNLSFAQNWVPISQAACLKATAKTNNPAIYIDATMTDRSTTAPGEAAIRKNISTLHLKWLAVPPQPADVQALYALYLAREATNAAQAWANVCAALLRDPLWLTY